MKASSHAEGRIESGRRADTAQFIVQVQLTMTTPQGEDTQSQLHAAVRYQLPSCGRAV